MIKLVAGLGELPAPSPTMAPGDGGVLPCLALLAGTFGDEEGLTDWCGNYLSPRLRTSQLPGRKRQRLKLGAEGTPQCLQSAPGPLMAPAAGKQETPGGDATAGTAGAAGNTTVSGHPNGNSCTPARGSSRTTPPARHGPRSRPPQVARQSWTATAPGALTGMALVLRGVRKTEGGAPRV